MIKAIAIFIFLISNFVFSQGAPNAAFSVSKLTLCEGECIEVTNTSSDDALTFSWMFDGGIPSSYNGENPGPICFNTSGPHSITLTATNTFGSNSYGLTVYVFPKPIAIFTSNVLTGQIPMNVTLSNLSLNATSYSWDFGNGSTQYTTDLSSVSTQYTIEGVYSVFLIASNGSCNDTAITTITINSNGCDTTNLSIDCDGDGVTNGDEIDPDGDGITGPNGTSPTDSCSLNFADQSVAPSQSWLSADCDGDGVTNGDEVDPDGDGVAGPDGTD